MLRRKFESKSRNSLIKELSDVLDNVFGILDVENDDGKFFVNFENLRYHIFGQFNVISDWQIIFTLDLKNEMASINYVSLRYTDKINLIKWVKSIKKVVEDFCGNLARLSM